METVEIVCVGIVIVCVLIFFGLMGLAWKAQLRDLAEIAEKRKEMEKLQESTQNEEGSKE